MLDQAPAKGSGSTHETVMATRLAKEAGARTICITNFGRSPIQAYADIVLTTMVRPGWFRSGFATISFAPRRSWFAIDFKRM